LIRSGNRGDALGIAVQRRCLHVSGLASAERTAVCRMPLLVSDSSLRGNVLKFLRDLQCVLKKAVTVSLSFGVENGAVFS
jgi:hypothetical protein